MAMRLTVGSTVLPATQSHASPSINLAYARSNVVLCNYTWNVIINVDAMQVGMQSPVFSVDICRNLKWSLRFGPTDSRFNSPIFLCCENSERSKVKAKFRIRLVDPFFAGNITSPEMTEYCVFKPGTEKARYGYTNFCPIQSGRFRDYACDIHCDIEVYLNNRDSIVQDPREPLKVPQARLLDDMASVFATGKFTDFIITSDGVSFPVHKAILSARSSVFASMFEHNLKEQLENHVEIPDTTPEILKEMLRFIYTDKVNEINEVAYDLLAVAEKYALDRLKAMCEESLCGILAVEIAAEILIHADLHQADQLKTRTFDFIDCHATDVIETPGFKSMITSHPHLTAEILRAVVTKRNQDGDS